MRARPKGAKYRNLVARGGVIQYRRVVGGKVVRFSTRTNDWDEAAAAARLYEEGKGIGLPGFVLVDAPTFADFARRYVNEDTGRLAETTRDEYGKVLKPEGEWNEYDIKIVGPVSKFV